MNIFELHWLAIAMAGVVTTILLNIGQPLARRAGWVDKPNARKIHTTDTPLFGGVAMYIGFASALIFTDLPWLPLEGIFVGCGVSLLVGYLDDMHDIRAYIRFLVELSIAMWLVISYQLEIHTLGNLFGFGEVTLGRWSLPFTVICIVGVINAINMSDGSDGQAGGQSLISFTLMLIMAVQPKLWAEASVLLLFVAVLLPFLFFNAPLPFLKRTTALVFMGDAGSMFLGIGLVWFAVKLSQGETPAMNPVTSLWLIAVPLIDMFGSIVRRRVQGKKIFAPDLGHIHHFLRKSGASTGKVCLYMVGLTTLFGLSGMIADWLKVPEAVMFYLLVAIFILYCWAGIACCKWHKYC